MENVSDIDALPVGVFFNQCGIVPATAAGRKKKCTVSNLKAIKELTEAINKTKK